MKKKIVFIILFVLLIGAVVGVAVVSKVRKPADGPIDGANKDFGVAVQQKDFMSLETVEELEKFAKENKIEHGITEDKMIASLLNVQFIEEGVSITYFFDEGGKATDVSAAYFLNATELENGLLDVSEISLDEVVSKSENAMRTFCQLFDCAVIPDVYLYNFDGTFTKVESAANYQAIIDESAVLKLSIRDREGYFWEMEIASRSGAITVTVNKFFDKQAYMDYVANISLYEEKE